MNNTECKPEKWSVADLRKKVTMKTLLKPKQQRDATWGLQPIDGKKKASIREYIEFLLKRGSDVEAIIVNKRADNKEYLVDGNHRITAKIKFYDSPLSVFPDKKEELRKFISKNYHEDEQDTIMDIFVSLNYDELMNFRYKTHFENCIKGMEWYKTHMKNAKDEWDEFYEGEPAKNIPSFRNAFLTSQGKKFTETTTIISYFDGLTPEKECEVYIDVNRYKNVFTETSILAAFLHDHTNFTITNSTARSFIESQCHEMYDKRDKQEVLDCYKYDGIMNAFDFTMGYQNWCHKRCPFFEMASLKAGTTLFFKVWKGIFDEYTDTFTTANVTRFVEYIEYAIDIFNKVTDKVLPNILSDKLFKAAKTKMYSLKTNNMFALIMAICGFKNNGACDEDVIISVAQSIVYHYGVAEIKNDELKKSYKIFDIILYEDGGSKIKKLASELYKTPNNLTKGIPKKRMEDVLDILQEQSVNNRAYETRIDGKKNKNDNRRGRKFVEILLMTNAFRHKVPVEYVQGQIFEYEHIVPFSSSWEENVNLDIDRLGNIIPIINKINNKRRAGHIKRYHDVERENGTDFIRYLDPFIPSHEKYDAIVSHESTKPSVIDVDAYNNMCVANEQAHKVLFLNSLYPEPPKPKEEAQKH